MKAYTMPKKNTILLLHIIKNHRNVDQLIREGLTYRDITALISDNVEANFINYNEDILELTATGEHIYQENKGLLSKKNKNEWIQKDERSRIAKISKESIFLPNQNDLIF